MKLLTVRVLEVEGKVQVFEREAGWGTGLVRAGMVGAEGR